MAEVHSNKGSMENDGRDIDASLGLDRLDLLNILVIKADVSAIAHCYIK